jgi:hypothetical protein
MRKMLSSIVSNTSFLGRVPLNEQLIEELKKPKLKDVGLKSKKKIFTSPKPNERDISVR